MAQATVPVGQVDQPESRDDRIAPNRSRQQRMEALNKANAVRKERAELKRNIRAGRVDVAALIENPPDWLETMKVFELLKALPKVGRIKANTLMRKFKISPSKTVGGLSDRQRLELANGVRTRQPGSMRIGSAAA